MKPNRSSVQELLSAFLLDASHFPCEDARNDIGPVATPAEIEHLEKTIKTPLPSSFRKFLLTETSSIEFEWQLEGDALIRLRDERESISRGGISFSLQSILQENPQFRPDFESDEYSEAYRPQALLAFASTPNGDQFAVSLAAESAGSIRYLSHDIDDIHMYEVGTSFASFVQNYGRLGFVGPEYWVWEQFTNNRTTPIDATCSKAKEFLEALRTSVRSAEAEANLASAEAAARVARFNVMILPRAQQLLDAKQYRQFIELVESCSDLLPKAMRARYDYLKKKMS